MINSAWIPHSSDHCQWHSSHSKLSQYMINSLQVKAEWKCISMQMSTALSAVILGTSSDSEWGKWHKNKWKWGETGNIKETELSSRLAESPDPCNGWKGTFTACSALGLTGSSLVFHHHCNELPTISAVKLVWTTEIEDLKFGQHGRNWGLYVYPWSNNTFFFKIVHSVSFSQLSPWLDSALSIYSARVAGKATLGLHILGWKFCYTRILAKQNLLSCVPSLKLKLIGLESVDGVLVDVENEQVKLRAASNLVTIFLLSWIQFYKLVHLLSWTDMENGKLEKVCSEDDLNS
jgi:hypothetical protein